MVTAVKPAYDVGGFGRLADVRFRKRAEEREVKRLGMQEKAAEQSYRLRELQIQQTETNLQKIKRQAELRQRKAELRDGLARALSNIPEGENKFTTAYNFYEMQGASEELQTLIKSQSDRLNTTYKLDKNAAIKEYNESLGKVAGITANESMIDAYKNKTTDIKEYEYAKENSGFVGSLMDWKTKSGKSKDTKRTKSIVDLELEDAVTERFKKEQNLSDSDARLKAQAFIAENKKGKGISITTDKDGNQTISIGGKTGTGDLTKGTTTSVQKNLLEANETHSNMKAIVGKVEDKFLEIPTKLGVKMTALKEKWKVGNVSDMERKELEEYTAFRRESIASLNSYIKQITGAAMSELEAKRLMKAMPTPGLGLFDGDSPTEFRTKLNGVMESLDRVVARNNYVAKYGLSSFEDISLDKIDSIIDRRGDSIYLELKEANPDMAEEDLKTKTKKELSEEFGLRF